MGDLITPMFLRLYVKIQSSPWYEKQTSLLNKTKTVVDTTVSFVKTAYVIECTTCFFDTKFSAIYGFKSLNGNPMKMIFAQYYHNQWVDWISRDVEVKIAVCLKNLNGEPLLLRYKDGQIQAAL